MYWLQIISNKEKMPMRLTMVILKQSVVSIALPVVSNQHKDKMQVKILNSIQPTGRSVAVLKLKNTFGRYAESNTGNTPS